MSDISDDQANSMSHSIPSIEIEENNLDSETELTSEQVQALRDAFPQFCASSPNTSLQVPALNSSTPLSDLSESEINSRSYIEDTELEKKFNNIAFSFKTDQYTLQKRIENQVRFYRTSNLIFSPYNISLLRKCAYNDYKFEHEEKITCINNSLKLMDLFTHGNIIRINASRMNTQT